MKTSFIIAPLTIDPRKCGDRIASAMVFMLYDGLTQLNPDGSVAMSLARSVTVSNDGLIYTFHLRKASWSDGTPLTAHDFEYSWKTALDPHFPSITSHLFSCIKNAEKAKSGKISVDSVGITALSEQVLQVELSYPAPYFLSLVSFCVFFPIPRHICQADPAWDKKRDSSLVTSGPFRLKSWLPNKEIIVDRNPLYWDALQVKTDQIHIRIVPHPETNLKLYEQGELDWISPQLSPLPMESLYCLRKQQEMRTSPLSSTFFCSINLRKPFFQNRNIRLALSLAIDRNELVRKASHFDEIPAHRFIPPSLMEDNASSLLSYEPAVAKRLFRRGLCELGLIQSDETESLSITDSAQFREFLDGMAICHDSMISIKAVAESIRDQWKRAFGFITNLRPMDNNVLLEHLFLGDYSLALYYLTAQYPDPMNILERFKNLNAKNYPGFEQPLYNQLLDYAEEIANPQQRSHMLEAAESLFVHEMPLIPLFHFNYLTIAKPYVHGIAISSIGSINLKSAYVSKSKPEAINHNKEVEELAKIR